MLVRNVFRAAGVSPCCVGLLLLWGSLEVSLCLQQTEQFFLVSSFFTCFNLESTSIGNLNFLQKHFNLDWLIFTGWFQDNNVTLWVSDWKWFNVTSWHIAQQGRVAGSLYPFGQRLPLPPHPWIWNWWSKISWKFCGSICAASVVLSIQHSALLGTSGLTSTASVWQLWFHTTMRCIWSPLVMTCFLELHMWCNWIVQPIVTGVKKSVLLWGNPSHDMLQLNGSQFLISVMWVFLLWRFSCRFLDECERREFCDDGFLFVWRPEFL